MILEASRPKEREKEERHLSKLKQETIEWVIAITIAVAIVLVVRLFIVTNYEVSGKSMMPTLSDQDRVLISKISPINRMDIIIFNNGEEDFVKRVIGVPGDTIKYENDELFVNGKKVDEPFLKGNIAYNNPDEHFTEDFDLYDLTGYKTVPKGKLFVLGDNRMASLDSRYFHFIDKDEVIGEVKMKYLPIADATFNFSSE